MIALLLALTTLAAPSPTPGPPDEITGGWGGRGAGLQASASGGRLELDCAHATIPSPLTVRRDGRFRFSGTFVLERPGPAREGRDDGAAAVFEGSREGT